MARLIVLMITAFVDMVGLVMVLPLLPYYATHLGASSLVVGMLISAFGVAQLVVAPAWGRLSDHYGRRPALLTGLLVSAIGYVIFAGANTIWLLLLSRVVQGIGGGTVGVVQAYVSDVSDPRQRAKSLGWLSAITSLGAVVGPALGSLFAKMWGPHAPGYAAAILCIGVSGFAWKYLAESREVRASGATRMPSSMTSMTAIRRVVSHSAEPASRLIWIYTVAIGAFYGTVPTLPLLLSDRLHVTEENVGYFVMYLGGMGVIVRAGLLGKFVDWLGEAVLARIGLLSLAAGLALLPLVYGYGTLALSLTLMPIGTAFLFPAVTALLSRVVPSGERGLYLGVQQTFGGVSRVAFPILTGFMMDHWGRGLPYLIAGLLVLATLPLTAAMESYGLMEAAT